MDRATRNRNYRCDRAHDRLNSADRSIAVLLPNRLNRRHGCCGNRKDEPTDETRKRTDARCSRTLARRLETMRKDFDSLTRGKL